MSFNPNNFGGSVHSAIDVVICRDDDAIAQGYDYAHPKPGAPVVNPIHIDQVVIVKNGTAAGNATVDFVLRDETGQRFVFMITAHLLGVVVGAAS